VTPLALGMMCKKVLLCLSVPLFFVCVGIATHKEPTVYEKTCHSTVRLIRADLTDAGTGVMVGPRLIVTNAHCVKGQEKMGVYSRLFFEADGNNWSREDYVNNSKIVEEKRAFAWGTVAAFVEGSDLCVLRLETDLGVTVPIELAKEPPKVGEVVHVVGNPDGRNLFTYSVARTRGTEAPPWGGRKRIACDGHVWFGNSGGPVVNDAGELVGVVCHMDKTSVYAVDMNDLRALLKIVVPEEDMP
jgi:S1-C subfamily serine protease